MILIRTEMPQTDLCGILILFCLPDCLSSARKAADAALRTHAVALTIRLLRPLRTDGAAVTRRIRLEAPVFLA